MKLKTLMAVAFAAAMLLAGGAITGAKAGDSDSDLMHVVKVRVLESIPGVPNSAVYLMIHNANEMDDRLVAAATPAAKRAELHTHIMDDGIMRMRRVEAFAAPSNVLVKLASGGDHIMLLGLKEPLTVGMEIPLTLTFEHAGEITLTAPVVARDAGHHGHDGHESHDGHSMADGGADVRHVSGDGGIATHVGHMDGHHHHGATNPIGVMGGHTMGAGQWMVS